MIYLSHESNRDPPPTDQDRLRRHCRRGTVPHSFSAGPAKANAFALCGDESHNSDYIRTALTATLMENGPLTIDFTDQEKLLTYDNLRNYKILIMFRDGRRYNNGYWHQIYWNEKPDKIVTVPPIERKIGSGFTSWMTPNRAKALSSGC